MLSGMLATGSRKIVVNADLSILHNPSKSELQGLFESAHERYGISASRPDVLRGVVDTKGNHHWGAAYEHTHEELLPAGETAAKKIFVSGIGAGNGKFYHRGEFINHPGIGSGLKPIREPRLAMNMGRSVNRKHARYGAGSTGPRPVAPFDLELA